MATFDTAIGADHARSDASSSLISTTRATRSMSASWASKCCASAPRDSRDHAVDHSTRGDARGTATTVDAHSAVEVGHGVKAQELEALQQPAQIGLSLLVARTGQHLHDDRLGDRHGTGGFDQFFEATMRETAGRPVVLDPGGGVGEDHAAARGGMSAGSSAMA